MKKHLPDILAGLTLGVILIPQGMAYGLLAGVPPVYGLYAALVPMVIYTLLATTPHVNVGPTALASLLCLNGLSGFYVPGTEEYLRAALLLAAMTGMFQLAFGLLKMGNLVSLLSRPVLSGFVSAAAILIMASQVRAFFGVDLPRSSYLHETVLNFVGALREIDWWTTALGVLSLIVLLLGSRYLPKWPVMLVWIVLTTACVGIFGLATEPGIAVVGGVPGGLPGFSLPLIDGTAIANLWPVALVLALISFVETLSIGKNFAAGYGHYRIIPDRELLALGASKVAGAFFGAVPTSASFSRSAVLEGAGAMTRVGGLAAAALLVVTLLFLTPVFYYLPIPVLAAVIIFSVRNLFDLAEMKRLYKLAPTEFATLFVTFVFTLFAGLQYGIAGGVLLSLAFVLLRAARPHLAELGRVAGTNAFRNVNRFAGAEVDPRILIVRFDAELYFGNAEYFRAQLETLVEKRGAALETVIIDAHTIHDLDTTGIFVLNQVYDGLRKRGVDVLLTGVIGPVRDKLYRSGLMEKMGVDRYFLSIQSALAGSRVRGDWDLPAVQHG